MAKSYMGLSITTLRMLDTFGSDEATAAAFMAQPLLVRAARGEGRASQRRFLCARCAPLRHARRTRGYTRATHASRAQGLVAYASLHFTELLVGPRCAKLAVKDPARFHFDRAKLMGSMAKLVTQLGGRPEFVGAVRCGSCLILLVWW